VGIVHITHVKAGTVALEAARSQGGKCPLVRQLIQRVGLLHELRELAAPKELAHDRHHRTHVDQRDWRELIRVTDTHALTHHTLHAQKAYAQLVLDQLAHGLDAPVAQVINIIRVFHTIIDLDHACDDAHQVLLGQRAVRNGDIQPKAPAQLVATNASQIIATGAKEQGLQIALGVFQGRRVARPHPPVELGDRILGVLGRIIVDGRPDIGTIRGVIHVGKKCHQLIVRTVKDGDVIDPIRYCGHGPEQNAHRDLALAIHLDGDDIASACIEFQPRTSVRDQLGHAHLPPGSPVLLQRKVCAGRPNQLAHNDAFRPIDDKGGIFRHDREIAHIHILYDGLIRLTVIEEHLHIERCGIGAFPLTAFLFAVGRGIKVELEAELLVDLVIIARKVHLEVPVKADDGRDLVKELAQPVLPEPGERLLLRLDQVRDIVDFGNACVRLAWPRPAVQHCRIAHSRRWDCHISSFSLHRGNACISGSPYQEEPCAKRASNLRLLVSRPGSTLACQKR